MSTEQGDEAQLFFKKKKVDNYTVLDNTCLRDTTLSWKAKGLHAYCASLPGDWVLRLNHLINQSPDGRKTIYSALTELINHGYCRRIQLRDSNGLYSGNQYQLTETPFNFGVYQDKSDEDSRRTQKRHAVKRYAVERDTVKVHLLNTNTNQVLKELTTNSAVETEKETEGKSDSQFSLSKVIREIFSGIYPFDSQFEGNLIKLFSSSQLAEDKWEEYLVYVYERTKSANPKKSFAGLFHNLALEDSILSDYMNLPATQENSNQREKREEPPIKYIECPVCKTKWDEREFSCPTCSLSYKAIVNKSQDEIDFCTALYSLTEDQKQQFTDTCSERGKSKQRGFLYLPERIQVLKDLGFYHQ